MTFQDTGKSERTQTRRKRPAAPANLEQLLIKIAKEHPKATAEELGETFVEEAREVVAFVDEALGFWLRLNRRRLLEPAPAPAAPQQRMTPEQAAEAVERAKTAQQTAVLLNMRIGDRMLRDMNREECFVIGGWLNLVAEKLQPGQLVGDVFTEKQLIALSRRNKIDLSLTSREPPAE